MLQRLYKNLYSNTRVLESLFVLEGLKPSARFALKFQALNKAVLSLQSLGLKVATSDFGLKMSFVDSYSTKGKVRRSGIKNDDYIIVYVSKNEAQAMALKQYEAGQEVKILGKSLGYPDCCIEFFCRHRKDELLGHNDYIKPLLAGSKKCSHSPLMNVFTRYFDMPLLSHAPCSLSCKRSYQMALERYSLLNEKYAELASQFRRISDSVALYEQARVMLLLDKNIDHTNTFKIKYKNVLCTPDNPLLELLRKSTCIDLDSTLETLRVGEYKKSINAALFSKNADQNLW